MSCPACAEADLVETADLGSVPALCGVTWPQRAAAQCSPLGAMVLSHCPRCAHVVNAAYDPALLQYSASYDNSLHHSPTFRDYAGELAGRLATTYGLSGGTILELGCGKGDFLLELCDVAGAVGVGYDASYQGPDRVRNVRFVKGFLDMDDEVTSYDFVVARHVLEHLEDPIAFLTGLRRSSEGRVVHGYLEVPNAAYDFSSAGWDCIYPHVSYFNAASLARIVERAGYEVLHLGTSFADQFLFVEVAAGTTRPQPKIRGDHQEVAAAQLARVEAFGSRYHRSVELWQARIVRMAAQGGTTVLWGAGARGVAFLNAVDPERRLAAVVDLNPSKWDRYVPVSGHRVGRPEDLVQIEPDVVVITNAAYEREIMGMLDRLHLSPEIVVA